MRRLTSHNFNHPRRFKVTTTETLKRTVEVETANQREAEQMVSDSWYRNCQLLPKICSLFGAAGIKSRPFFETGKRG